jgi:hypothetical protein
MGAELRCIKKATPSHSHGIRNRPFGRSASSSAGLSRPKRGGEPLARQDEENHGPLVTNWHQSLVPGRIAAIGYPFISVNKARGSNLSFGTLIGWHCAGPPTPGSIRTKRRATALVPSHLLASWRLCVKHRLNIRVNPSNPWSTSPRFIAYRRRTRHFDLSVR